MDNNNESDDSHLLFPPMPKKRRMSSATSFAKCIICQSDSNDDLRKAKESSISNLISKLQIRQDEVYERLKTDFNLLHENEVFWHASCYATCTSKQNIKYAAKAVTEVEERAKKSTEPGSSERVSRSGVAPHDWSKCLFCKKRTYKKEKSMINASSLEVAETIRQCAEAKGDHHLLRILLGVNNDLVAAEAKYHKICHASYISKSNLKSQAFREDAEKESVYDQAFHEMVISINGGLKSGHAYDMSSLLKKYAELLEEKGVDGQAYTKQKLKLRIKSHYGEEIVFHQPYNKSSPELLYSSSISLKDVINASAINNSKVPDQPLNRPAQEPSTTQMLYRTAKLLKDEIKQCNGISIYPVSVNDIDLATAKHIVPRELYLFLRWMITNDDADIDTESSCNNQDDERKVLSLSQDVIHCTSHGRVKLPKHIGLAMSVRHTTGSKQLVTVLSRMGHCSSYDELESVDTSLAKEILAKSQQNRAVIPSNIFPGPFVQFAADNNDLNEETLDGKSTTHATTLVVYQKKTFGPMPPPEVYADQSRKQRSLEKITVDDEILDCSGQGKRPPVKDFIGKLTPEADIFTTGEEYKSACKEDLTWVLTRISPTESFTIRNTTNPNPEAEIRETIDQCVPGWSGYNSLIYPNTTLPTVIGYCPMINGSSTELSTIYTVIKKAQNICASLGQRDTVVTFDLAIYCKAKLITWKYPEEFTNTVIRLGGFHVALNFLSVLGKRYQSSGIEDILIESAAYGSGTVASLMKGKSYNRGMRAHKLMMEALLRLMWQAFIKWLNADDHQAYKLQAKEKEKQVVEGIKSINLAIKSKKNIVQKANSATKELETVMKMFETFRKEEKARSQMFAFWDEYIRMVIMLLQFVKAERTRNWHLHLQSVSAMIPYFFAHDRPNYARWLPVYVADMQQLQQKHPEVYKEFVEGQHAISRSSQPFASVWTDMALEQSINLDSKSKAGIIGISQNAEALRRWFLTCHERASLTTAVKHMCRIGDSDRVGTHVHKEGAPKRVERDENDVQKILSCFKSGLMKDPFSEDCESLCNVATGVVLPTAVADELLKADTKGKEQMKGYIQDRLNSSNTSIWETIPCLKIKTFSCLTKKTATKSANEKLEIVSEDRDLFGRLLIVANVRQVNLREILSFELSSVPYSLAHTDGTLRKTNKSVLMQILEKNVTVEPRLTTEMPTVHVFDAMAIVQMMRFAAASTFGEMATKYFEFITSFFRQGCQRVDVVFDQYWQLSIKAGERMKRGESNALEVRIHGKSTPVPKQFTKYISNSANKRNLSAFLTEAWIEMAKDLPEDKEFVIGGETAFLAKNGQCYEVPALNSDHEEADTRMLLHAQHASETSQRVVILSPDTDVLILSVTHYDEIGCEQLWFRTGVKDRLRYIPAHKIATHLGPAICKALPAFHSLTGCDSTSALFRVGKTKAWNGITKNQAHLNHLAEIGQSPDIDEQIATNAEVFICSLYDAAKKSPKTSDEARYLMFCQKTKNNLLLPPTSDSLKQHIARANFQSYVWRRALVARQDLPSPVGYGWKLEDNELCPLLMTKPAAPKSILELTNCKCSTTSKCSKNCSCSNNGLACTEACICMADDSCSNPNKPCLYESDEDDEESEDDLSEIDE